MIASNTAACLQAAPVLQLYKITDFDLSNNIDSERNQDVTDGHVLTRPVRSIEIFE